MHVFSMTTFPPSEPIDWFFLRADLLEGLYEKASAVIWEPESEDDAILSLFREQESVSRVDGLTYTLFRMGDEERPSRWDDFECRGPLRFQMGWHARMRTTRQLIAGIRDLVGLRESDSGGMTGGLTLRLGETRIDVKVVARAVEFGQRVGFTFGPYDVDEQALRAGWHSEHGRELGFSDGTAHYTPYVERRRFSWFPFRRRVHC